MEKMSFCSYTHCTLTQYGHKCKS